MPPPGGRLVVVAIGLFVATIGISIGLDADIFRDVAGAEVPAAARACRRTSRKLGRPELGRHTASAELVGGEQG